jgi:hypothetical protein
MDVNFLNIILDYEKLVNTQVKIHLDNNEIINFKFKINNLPHLLGLNKLVDIPKLLDYHNEKVSAKDIYIGIKDGDIDTEEFKKSKYYEEVFKSKIAHFNSTRIMNLLNSPSIIKFNPSKIKNFDTKLEKVDYLFYEIIRNENNTYSHFGIGFSNSSFKNHPNTFFVRDNNDYIYKQDEVYPMSVYIKDKNKKVTFKIYWDNVRKYMQKAKNSHYKKLNKLSAKYGYNVDTLKRDDIEKLLEDNISESEQELNDIQKHFRLLRLDEVKAVYIPYIDEASSWNNDKKQYLISKIDNSSKDYLPNEIKSLLNEFHPDVIRVTS